MMEILFQRCDAVAKLRSGFTLAALPEVLDKITSIPEVEIVRCQREEGGDLLLSIQLKEKIPTSNVVNAAGKSVISRKKRDNEEGFEPVNKAQAVACISCAHDQILSVHLA